MKAPGDPAEYRAGVGIVLINGNRDIFVGRRLNMPAGLPAWQMPQGGIDPGETPQQAALRELEEEIGTAKADILGETIAWHTYDLPAEVSGGLWGGRFRGQRQKWFAMRFVGDDTDIMINTDHPEFDAWRWAGAAELPELIVPFKRAVYIAVLTEFADLLRR